MNYTFQRVAAFSGLRISYYIAAALLALAFLLLVPTEYRTASPLYILLFLAVAPSIIKAMLFSKKAAEKRENNLEFPLFCQKYHYSLTMYKSMNFSYLLLFVLLAAWHISYSRKETIPSIIVSTPMLIAAAGLLCRVLATVGYRIYFHLFPLKAMH